MNWKQRKQKSRANALRKKAGRCSRHVVKHDSKQSIEQLNEGERRLHALLARVVS